MSKQLDEIIHNIASAVAYEAALEIGKQSVKVCPMDPNHDFSVEPMHLRESMEVRQGNRVIAKGTVQGTLKRTGKISKEKNVEIEYMNSYALEAHELPESSNFSTPGTGPKYLENAFTQIDLNKVGRAALKSYKKL